MSGDPPSARMMARQAEPSYLRKKRLFTGLVGFPPEPNEQPKVETTDAAPAPPTPEELASLDRQILVAAKKRGRPKKFETAAEKQAAYRARKADAAATAALKKALQDEIDFIMHENRDGAGLIHGETSGGDVIHRTERAIERKESGTPARPGGYNPKTFEEAKRTVVEKKETAYTWVNRQNFFAPSKWNKADKQLFAETLAEDSCIEVGTGFRCGFGDFDSEWRREVIEHYLKFHQRYIRASIRYCRPHPIELMKKPPKCTDADHARRALVFADRLPLRCRFCKAMIYPSEFRNTPDGNQ
jgi:hypothetical protein